MAERPARAGRGQHFLRSRALVSALVADAEVRPGDLVVDVGAGQGILTAELLERGAEVLAVEADPALAALLRRRFGPRVQVLEADARRLRWPRRPFHVVANLPFGGGTEILRGLLDDPCVPLQRGEIVLQWEVAAKRAAVWPATLQGVVWGGLYELELARRLPRNAFAPPPSVDAGVLRVVRRREPLVPPEEWAAYRAFVRRAFEARAPVRRVASPRLVKRLALELGFSPDALPRDLDSRQWAELFRASARVR